MAHKVPPENPATWQDFGEMLFKTKDSDPGYIVLNYLRESGVNENQLKRFAVAWCSYYNLGIAADASEKQGAKFYEYLNGIYETAKRATERRHFRGKAGLSALSQWQGMFPKPEALADFMIHDDLADVRRAAQSVAQMGTYFVWKWGDLSEVLGQKSCKFDGYEKWSPKLPLEGARLIAEEAERPDMDVGQVYRAIRREMVKRDVESPYAPWRNFGVQDSETVCCVYKQYRSGSYRPGIRTAKAWARLGAATSRTAHEARRMLIDGNVHYEEDEFQDILDGTLVLDPVDVLAERVHQLPK